MAREIKIIFNSVDTWECSAFFFITVIICIVISSISKEDRFLIGVLIKNCNKLIRENERKLNN